MVFVFKRVMLHVYGIKTDLRNRVLEDELFDLESENPAARRSPALCGIIFSQSYDTLRANIEEIARA
jgi:hypothetical protein